MDVDVERVGAGHALLGEGPVWDDRESALWWLDIPGQSLHRFDPGTGMDTRRSLGRQVGALVPRRSGGLVLATPEGFVAFDPATGEESLLAPVEADNPATRMNDGKCDRQGRFWAGTMAYEFQPGAGGFYRLDPDMRVTQVLSGCTVSNGLAWSPDDRLLYYIDSMTRRIDVFDFDPSSGRLTDRRPFVEIPESAGLPDGMCIDEDGYLWVALFGGSAVRRYSPAGGLDGVIAIPATKVTCCAFGGADLRDLYITTARIDLSDDELAAQPEAGGLFRCRPGVAGTAVNAFSA